MTDQSNFTWLCPCGHWGAGRRCASCDRAADLQFLSADETIDLPTNRGRVALTTGPRITRRVSSVTSSQNNPSRVYVVNVPERLDGLYVFASFACADAFATALGDTDHTLTEAPINDRAGTTAMVEAERAGDE